MPDANDANLAKVAEEHLGRVHALYETKAKSFQTFFIGLTTFALIFFFVITVPFVSSRRQQVIVARQQATLGPEIDETQARLTAYQTAQNGIEQLLTNLHSAPDSLKEFIRNRVEQCPWPSTSDFFQGQTLCPSGQTKDEYYQWMDEKVRDQVGNMFAEYAATLTDSVASPLQAITTTVNPVDLITLNQGLQSLQLAFEQRLAEQPRFWTTYEGKVNLFDELGADVSGFWANYENAIGTESDKLTAELDGQQRSVEALEKQYAQLEIDQTKMADRLRDIEYPFGKIPVGLEEAIALFPVILAIGFVVCSSLLAETTRLRQTFQRLYQSKDPTKSILTDQQIALIAPVWIEPLNPARSRVGPFIALSVPSLVFVAACALTLYVWTIPTTIEIANFTEGLYISLYVLGAGLFIYGYWQVIFSLRQYALTLPDEKHSKPK